MNILCKFLQILKAAGRFQGLARRFESTVKPQGPSKTYPEGLICVYELCTFLSLSVLQRINT